MIAIKEPAMVFLMYFSPFPCASGVPGSAKLAWDCMTGRYVDIREAFGVEMLSGPPIGDDLVSRLSLCHQLVCGEDRIWGMWRVLVDMRAETMD